MVLLCKIVFVSQNSILPIGLDSLLSMLGCMFSKSPLLKIPKVLNQQILCDLNHCWQLQILTEFESSQILSHSSLMDFQELIKKFFTSKPVNYALVRHLIRVHVKSIVCPNIPILACLRSLSRDTSLMAVQGAPSSCSRRISFRATKLSVKRDLPLKTVA